MLTEPEISAMQIFLNRVDAKGRIEAINLVACFEALEREARSIKTSQFSAAVQKVRDDEKAAEIAKTAET